MRNEQKLREAFEARMTYNGKWPNAIAKCRNGSYLLAHTENAWTEWLACAEALAQPAEGGEAVIDGDTSDGYHTFNELYEFRKAYNAALFNEWASSGKCNVHKSWRHYDGELCFGGGWFIVVAVLPDGQISNHYEAKDWELFAVPESERALFEFDGHTGSDVISRLKAYAPPASQEQAHWAEYVAGMVDHWVRSEEYASIKADEDRCTKAIAGIIERRLWALKRGPANQEQAQQPQALMDAWGISHALAKLFACEYMGAKLATIELATKPQAQASRSRLVDIDDLKDAIQSIEDYRSGVDFGSHDRKLLGRLKAALATQPQAQYHLPDAGKMAAQELPDERALPPLNVAQAELDELLDFIYEYSTVSEGISSRALKLCQAYARAALAEKQEPEPTLSALMGQDVTREQWERFKHWEAQELCPAR